MVTWIVTIISPTSATVPMVAIIVISVVWTVWIHFIISLFTGREELPVNNYGYNDTKLLDICLLHTSLLYTLVPAGGIEPTSM